ncbi:SsrA-binding protein SmpB [bacterium]|nr:SsrA-binding protein SmpB [bacterium]
MAEKKSQNRVVVQNKKARHLFEITDRIEAGIVLAGSEVKSLREGKGSVAEAYIVPRGNEMWLVGMHITPYEKASAWVEPAVRDRKLLLHRREIDRLAGAVSQKGMTLVPLKVYFSDRGHVKIEIGLARGKKAPDKRQDLKERQIKRELEREYKVR